MYKSHEYTKGIHHLSLRHNSSALRGPFLLALNFVVSHLSSAIQSTLLDSLNVKRARGSWCIHFIHMSSIRICLYNELSKIYNSNVCLLLAKIVFIFAFVRGSVVPSSLGFYFVLSISHEMPFRFCYFCCCCFFLSYFHFCFFSLLFSISMNLRWMLEHFSIFVCCFFLLFLSTSSYAHRTNKKNRLEFSQKSL